MFKKLKNWFLRRQVRRAQRRLNAAATCLYFIRSTHPVIEDDINKFLDKKLYPLLSELDTIGEKGASE